MSTNNKYKESILNAFARAVEASPHDINVKKTFGYELMAHGYQEDAYVVLHGVAQVDTDLEIQAALNELEKALHFADVISSDYHESSVEQKTLRPLGVTFADVIGMNDIKEAIRMDIIYPFKKPELFAAYNRGQGGGGLLLYGPPGCGKTLIAKATAGEIGGNFISASIHEILMGTWGDMPGAIANLFYKARLSTPSVIFLDEIDAIASSRSSGNNLLRPLVTELLTQMDGVNSNNDGVLVIAATNLPWEVDDALRRPGRFSRQIFVGGPCEQARKSIFEYELRKLPNEVESADILAKACRHMSAADISGMVKTAADKALREAVRTGNVVPISTQMILDSINESRSSILDWFGTAKSYVSYSNTSGRYDAIKEYFEKEGIA
jgi:transitional endoplasmic reticulum ATPase